MENEQSLLQKKITFATSEHVTGAIEMLKSCRTQLTSIIADTEYQTLVNALTLEIETNLIQRFIVEVDRIRTGKNLNE